MNEICSFARRVAFGRTIARDLSGRDERGRGRDTTTARLRIVDSLYAALSARHT